MCVSVCVCVSVCMHVRVCVFVNVCVSVCVVISSSNGRGRHHKCQYLGAIVSRVVSPWLVSLHRLSSLAFVWPVQRAFFAQVLGYFNGWELGQSMYAYPPTDCPPDDDLWRHAPCFIHRCAVVAHSADPPRPLWEEVDWSLARK